VWMTHSSAKSVPRSLAKAQDAVSGEKSLAIGQHLSDREKQ